MIEKAKLHGYTYLCEKPKTYLDYCTLANNEKIAHLCTVTPDNKITFIELEPFMDNDDLRFCYDHFYNGYHGLLKKILNE